MFYNHKRNKYSVHQERQIFVENHCSNRSNVFVEYLIIVLNDFDIRVIFPVDMSTKTVDLNYINKKEKEKGKINQA